MGKYFAAALLLVLLIFGIPILVRMFEGQPAMPTGIHAIPDTVRTERRFTPIAVKPNVLPQRVVVYAKPDTALRRAAEAQPIILGVQIRRESIHIQTLDQMGIVHDMAYCRPQLADMNVSETGGVEVILRRVKRRNRLKKALIVVGGVAVAAICVWALAK